MLLARLSAVEAERDIAAGNLRMAEGETRAAEARAEAAEQALQAVVEHEGHSSDAEDCLREAIETARAALTRSGGTDDE